MYDNIVIKTRPTHYFPMSSSSNYDLMHSGSPSLFLNFVDPGSASTINNPKTGFIFPIITNSGSAAAALKITKSSSYNFVIQQDISTDPKKQPYNLVLNNYKKPFSITFWLNFNNQINGQSKITESNGLGIFRIFQKSLDYNGVNVSTNLLEIAFDYSRHAFRLKFPHKDAKDQSAYCYVDKLDQNFQITATYSAGQIILKVNDEVGTAAVDTNSWIFLSNMDKKIQFLSTAEPNLRLEFLGSSLGDSSTPTYMQNYLVSGLAYYQRVLSDIDLQTLRSFAFQDGFPVSQSIGGDNSYFDFRDIGNFDEFSSNSFVNFESSLTSKYGDYEKISGSKFKISDLDNLQSTQLGVMPIKYNKPYWVKNTTTASLTVNSSSGIKISGKGYLVFDQPDYFDFSSKATITCSIDGLNNAGSVTKYNMWLLECGDTYVGLAITKSALGASYSYLVREFDVATGSENRILIQQDFNLATTYSDNIAVSFTNDKILLKSNLGGTSSVTLSKPYSSDSLDSFYIGNNPKDAYDNPIYIKNVGIVNRFVSDFSSFDFANPSTIMFRLTSFANTSSNSFIVSQFGTWSYTIPTATYPTCTVVGTQFNWNLDNCKVSISSDGGLTYNKITPYQPITNLDLNSVMPNLKVKMELQTENDYDDYLNLKLSQFEYLIYTNQNIYSNGTAFYLSNNNTSKANYTLSSQNSILSRHKNFGIKFTGDSSKSPGSASVINGASTGFQTIDFWYRPDNIASGSSNYLLNNVTGSVTSPAIWLNASAKFYSLGGTLYVNGVSVADNTYTASANELYHVVLSLSASSTSSLYLNGGVLGASAISGSATYGHLTFWKDQLTPSQILTRYQSYYYSNTVQLNDDETRKLFSASNTDLFKIYRLNT